MPVELRRATAADAAHLAPRLRAADLAELEAVHGEGVAPVRLLNQALTLSDDPLAAVADGEVFALFGCAPVSLLGGLAAPWMLGSDAVTRHARAAVLIGRRLVGEWSARYPVLENWVDARNVTSMRWLARIGFEIHPAEPYGWRGLPFHRFDLRTPSPAVAADHHRRSDQPCAHPRLS